MQKNGAWSVEEAVEDVRDDYRIEQKVQAADYGFIFKIFMEE
jgi:hypothetical protein